MSTLLSSGCCFFFFFLNQTLVAPELKSHIWPNKYYKTISFTPKKYNTCLCEVSADMHGFALLNSVSMCVYWKKAGVKRIKKEKSPNIGKQHTGRKQDRVYSYTDLTWLSLTTPGGESQSRFFRLLVGDPALAARAALLPNSIHAHVESKAHCCWTLHTQCSFSHSLFKAGLMCRPSEAGTWRCRMTSLQVDGRGSYGFAGTRIKRWIASVFTCMTYQKGTEVSCFWSSFGTQL